jgi:hypothetical protein
VKYKREGDIWLKRIDMQRESRVLNEVTVTGTKIKMVLRGDTVVYNADAFNLAEGSMLDALIRQLPGAELSKDGEIKVNGKKFKTMPADADGKCKFKVTQIPGTYKLEITSLGVTKTATLTVKHLMTLKKVTVKKSAKKLVLTATLAKINKKYLKGKKITFKFNGKKYAAKTDKKGVAKVTIKSTVLKKLKVSKKVTYQATYLKDTVKYSIKVKK